MEEKSEHFVFDFMRQYGPKDEKSLLGKIFSKMKKRDAKAMRKAMVMARDNDASDFDF